MGLIESRDEKDRQAATAFASRCACIDLEVGKSDAKIYQIGAVRLDPERSASREFAHTSGPLAAAWPAFDQFCAEADFALGHNFIVFDCKYLVAAKPDLALLTKPALDTLWLNPLAFPRNPYHHLVKHYQDGQLLSGQKNNPVADAHLTLAMLVEQFVALRKLQASSPELVALFHWLILPTGTGKSICYQIPALSRFDKTGALTVVISPLVALMADQVNGLEARGISCSAAINGLLSMPERAAVLERVRLGDIGILIVSPEQLRNRTLRGVLAQRQIGAWVLDEAHCISKWGHDFRPDYRYVGRFIREKAGDSPTAPILCLTATAKPDVVRDMIEHFSTKVGVELNLFDGGASRNNLSFSVMPTTAPEKLGHVLMVLNQVLPHDSPGGAIVYCSTRKKTEEVSAFLQARDIACGHFHAGLQPTSKKLVQSRFINGELKVIAATNAFGMGIDKPDVRLVIHADIPGSLENYLQEAGRAGRDREQAHCVLLYTPDDVERQFGMSARSRLSQREIQIVLKSLRSLDRRKKKTGEVVATAGEILSEDEAAAFERDTATDDTKVRTAIAWLEEATLLKRR